MNSQLRVAKIFVPTTSIIVGFSRLLRIQVFCKGHSLVTTIVLLLRRFFSDDTHSGQCHFQDYWLCGNMSTCGSELWFWLFKIKAICSSNSLLPLGLLCAWHYRYVSKFISKLSTFLSEVVMWDSKITTHIVLNLILIVSEWTPGRPIP